jgi:hypothetical protein
LILPLARLGDSGQTSHQRGHDVYDHGPSWEHPVSPADYVRDLQDYVRDEGHRPKWLRARVAEAGAV